MTPMRKTFARIVTYILFGLLILSFAVWGIGDIFRGGRQVEAVAEIGDVRIDQRVFGRALRREMQRLQPQFGGQLNLEIAKSIGIVDQVLRNMVTRALLDKQAAEMGLVISEDHLLTQIQRNPAFQADGSFDRNRFVRALQSNSLSEEEFLDDLRGNINRQQLVESASGSATAPRALAEILYAYREERRVAETILVPKERAGDIGEPDQAALESFYESVSGNFQAPEYRDVTLLWLRAEDLLDEIAPPDEETLRDEFEARRDDFATPEQRRVEQIVLPDEETALKAKAALDEGMAFDAASREHSGGEPIALGLLGRDDLAMQSVELADAIFASAKDEVGAPVQSPFGWHIVRVTEIVPAKNPSIAELRNELSKDLTMRAAIESMVSVANQLDDQLASGASLEEAARSLDLRLRDLPAVDRAGRDAAGNEIADAPPLDEFASLVFTTEPGEESLLNELSDGSYVIVRIDRVSPAAARPLEEVRNEITALWRESEQNAWAREKATAIIDQARGGGNLAEFAQAEGLEVTLVEPLTRYDTSPEPSRSQDLADRLFEIEKGEVTLASAPAGYLVAKLVEIRTANPLTDGAGVSQLQDGLAENLRNDLFAAFSEDLAQQFGVKVNQRLIDDLVTAF